MTAKKKRRPKGSGSVQGPEMTKDGKRFYVGRWTNHDGTRVARRIPDEHAKTADARGQWVARRGELALVPPPVVLGESCADWFGRRFDAREATGRFTTVCDARARVENWVLSHLVGKRMQDVTRADVETIVRALDAAVTAGDLAWKTAANVWGEVTAAFDEACNSKDLSLRVCTKDPTDGVRGPDRGIEKSKPFLYGSEVLALLSCEDVPLDRARVYAVAAYLGARQSELAAITAADIDFEHGKVNIVRQREKGSAKTRITKTKRTRSLDIEPALLPLLEVLVKEAPTGPLLAMPVFFEYGVVLREDLVTAGCKREALFARDEMREHVVFHGLRDTCLSHMAVRGDEPLKIQWRAGHTTFAMTQKYIEAARKVATAFGAPFPALPERLLGGTDKANGTAGEGSVADLAAVLGGQADTPDNDIHRMAAGDDGATRIRIPPSPLNFAEDGALAALPAAVRPEVGLLVSLRRALDAAVAAGQWDTVKELAATIAGLPKGGAS